MGTKNLYENGPDPFFFVFFDLMGTRMVQIRIVFRKPFYQLIPSLVALGRGIYISLMIRFLYYNLLDLISRLTTPTLYRILYRPY